MSALSFSACLDFDWSDPDTLRFLQEPAGSTKERYRLERFARAAALGADAPPGTMAREDDILALCLGEVTWSDPEVAQIARDRGDGFALIAAFRHYGAKCLERLHGVFAVIVLDPSRRTALAAIDRMGIQSLYYATGQSRFVAGATAQKVSAHPAVGRAVDPQAVFNYLYAHVVPAPGSIYAGVRKLLPAQFAFWRDGKLELDFYWHLRYQSGRGQQQRQLEDRFRGLLRDCVGESAGTEAEIATFLSGGTDSSTITGVLRELRSAPVRAYSIGFEAEGFDEMSYARLAAQHFAVTHRPYYVTPADVAQAIPIIASAYCEPFGNASAVPTYFCARRAADDGVRLMLAGDGGDELFGGNARYAKQRIFEWYGLLPMLIRKSLIEPALLGAGSSSRLSVLRKAASYVRQASVPLPDRLETYNFLLRQSLDRIFEPGFLSQIEPSQPAMLAREVYERADAVSCVDRMMHLDLKVTLADSDLPKVCRMCEAAGVDVRFPMLEEPMVEFSGEVPPDLKVRGLQLRYLFKHALRDFLPGEIIRKQKHGFGLPFGLWMQRDPALRELARASLSAMGRRGYLRADYIEDLQRRHCEENASYYGVMIWVLIILEQWLSRHDG